MAAKKPKKPAKKPAKKPTSKAKRRNQIKASAAKRSAGKAKRRSRIATMVRGARISKATVAAARKKEPGRYPLPVLEKKWRRLTAVLKARGSKVPE